MNADLDNTIETIFMVARPSMSHIASTLVRDIIRNGGDAKAFLPEGIMIHIGFVVTKDKIL
jgi:pantetheine-phosphate adenylyltransferase